MARRKLIKTRISVSPKLTKWWPLFMWKYCQECGYMVRREWVWRYEESKNYTSYICSKCCPTIDDAAKYLGITLYEMR